MALITSSWTFDSVSVLFALVAIFIAWVKWSQSYWSRVGLRTPPFTFFFGNGKGVFTQKQSFGAFTQEIYEYFKKQGQIHGGVYMLLMPTYVPLDPDIIKSVMQNDFEHFVNRGIYHNEESDPLSAHLFALDGTKWKNLRTKMTPTFTSGKMKMMFPTLVTCGDELVTEMNKNLDKGAIDIKNILERFTTDIVGSCAFGLDCNSLKNPDNKYTKHLKLFFVEGFWSNIVGMITFVAPKLAEKLSVKAINSQLSTFFLKMIKDTVDYREQNNIYRKDFMHLLLQLKNRGKLSDDNNILKADSEEKAGVTLTLDELAAQAFVFFVAGYETSSTTMTFCLFELASNPEIQEKLREEVCRVLEKHDNKLTYDAIMEMDYMDQVINETLRKYPPLPGLNRICTKKYKIPGTDLTLEEGTKVWIPVLGLHRDPEYYPNPEKFDPERFSDENKKNRHQYTFIPFGEGPRICIGLRFGVMQTKVGLSVLLKNYRFTLNSNKTAVPVQLDPKCFVMTATGGIWLDYTRC